MADLKLLIYQISAKDLEKLLEKFPVFASAELSDEARTQGAYENPGTKTGWYYTRNKAENGWVIYVGFCGGLISYSPSNPDTGLRFGMLYEYEGEGEILKTLHEVKRKGIAWDPKTKTKRFLKGKAPAVTVGGIDYIWLNKEECEAGQSRVMELVSLKLVAKAKPFGGLGSTNNYDEADELRNQSEFLALYNCTPQEKAKIVPVMVSRQDNFMTATPVFEKQKTSLSDAKPVNQAVTASVSGEGK